ncbi:MAG TPA: thiamine phosphate synthase [Bryobacteraceae bacterium]|nr:thiamine phosphate synthase [Bryobacteraceae bacterium]
MNRFALPRFYPILDKEVSDRFKVGLEAAAASILEAGARILQFRHKGSFSRGTVETIERIAALCRDAGALFVVNDRADIALIVGAAVHLGQEDLAPTAARHFVGRQAIIGYSTHNERQLTAAGAEPVDYLALGPIFETASKRNPDSVVGLERLRLWRPLTPRPLVAIGGITRANASSALEAGANSVAVIGDLFPNVRARAKEWIATVG